MYYVVLTGLEEQEVVDVLRSLSAVLALSGVHVERTCSICSKTLCNSTDFGAALLPTIQVPWSPRRSSLKDEKSCALYVLKALTCDEILLTTIEAVSPNASYRQSFKATNR